MRTIYLLRHGRPFGAEAHRCLGCRTDPPLSAAGAAAAGSVAQIFSAETIRAVGSSPLLRCTETAAALFPGQAFRLLPGLTELDCGDWDGLTFDEIRTRWPAQYARRGSDPTLPPPGGETLSHAAARAEAALRAFLSETEGDIAVVSHSGVIRALLCALTDGDFARHRNISQPYLCINLLRFDGRRFTVDGVGLTAL